MDRDNERVVTLIHISARRSSILPPFASAIFMKNLLDPALIVAVCALALTIYQAYLTRRHNRLSVRPLLDRAMQKDRKAEGITISFFVRNSGAGPAVIKQRSVYLDKAAFGDMDNECVEKVLQQCFGDPSRFEIRSTSFPGIGTALLPGQQIRLAEIHFPSTIWCNNEQEIMRRFDRIGYLIRYESLYNEEQAPLVTW